MKNEGLPGDTVKSEDEPQKDRNEDTDKGSGNKKRRGVRISSKMERLPKRMASLEGN